MCTRVHEGPRSATILGHYSTIFIYIGFQSKPELAYIATLPSQLTLSSLGRKCQAQSTLTWVSGDSNSGPRVCTCFHIWISSPLFKCCSLLFFFGGGCLCVWHFWFKSIPQPSHLDYFHQLIHTTVPRKYWLS